MSLAVAASPIAAPSRRFQAVALRLAVGAGILLYFLALQTRFFSLGLFEQAPLGRAFNDMLLSLLDGRFDVRPDLISIEGFVGADGKTYSYFGIVLALLRLPFVGLGGFASLDLTALSSTVAASLAAICNLLSVRWVAWRFAPAALRNRLTIVLGVAAVMSGPAVALVGVPAIYHEPILWGFALSSLFLNRALPLLLDGEAPQARNLMIMALCAGLALLTRFSTGLGLCAASGLALLVLLAERRNPGSTRTRLGVSAILASGAILLAFGVVCGLVNAARWGNPFVFGDLPHQISVLEDPARLARLQAYGPFNIARLWIGLSYYFLPLDWLPLDGIRAAVTRLIDQTEAPPSSLLLTEPLWILLAVTGVGTVFAGPSDGVVDQRRATAVAAGFALTPLLLLVAIYMAFRYRVEFMPAVLLFAFVGLAARLRSLAALPAAAGARFMRVLAILAAIQLLAAALMAGLFRMAPFGFTTTDFMAHFLA